MRHVSLLALVFLAGLWFGGREPAIVSAAGGPPDFAAVIARANPGVVRVSVRSNTSSGNRSRDDGVGAGFVVDPAGLVLTSRHVVSGATRIQVTVPGRGVVDAVLVGQDAATDTALLRVNVPGLRALPTGDVRSLRLGQWVLAGGSPYNLPNSWSVGIVSGLGRSNVGVGPRGIADFIQTDAATNLGNSGGPLLDADGRVVGVMTAILSRTGGHQGVGLALPIDVALGAVARMRGGGGTPARPSIGVRVRALRTAGDRPAGLVVTGFDPNAVAQAAGLRVRDVLLQADGVALERAADLQRIVWGHARGEVVRLLVQRGAQRIQIPVRLR